MAYTSVIPVYRLDNAVRYAQDKQKTTRQHGMPLAETVDYALNREKTETDGFESGLGCTTQSAYEDMRANAVRWHKTDGVQGYHLVQSFAEGEVTPELAHKIGLELAERVLGGRYQAIVTTHLNTSHYHNHIVWSSVAMNSGRKYHSNAKSYALEIRAVSDELCVKYGLSIIQTERAAQVSKPYAEWLAEKNGQPTWRTVIRQDVDAALAEALTWRQFIRELESKLTALSINRMLKERQYTGYLITKDVTSPYMPELQIIDQELFDQAQEIVTQRKTKNAEWRNIPRQNGNGALLGGNLYCATCGRRMTSSNPGKGAKRDKAEYICYMGANHRNNCTGQRSYVAKRVEDIVLQATRLLLDTIKDTPRDESVEARVQAEIKELKYDLRKTQQQIEEAAKEQEGLEMEVSRCLLGKSNFTTAMLSRLIDNKARERRELENKALDLERRLKNEKEMSEKVAEYYNRFLGWSMEFGLATIERKRIIISQLYKRIELGRGYVVNFEVDWNYEQFIDALQMEKHKGMTEVGIPMPPKVKKRVTKNINRKSDGAA